VDGMMVADLQWCMCGPKGTCAAVVLERQGGGLYEVRLLFAAIAVSAVFVCCNYWQAAFLNLLDTMFYTLVNFFA
jgi:hypothetical protein